MDKEPQGKAGTVTTADRPGNQVSLREQTAMAGDGPLARRIWRRYRAGPGVNTGGRMSLLARRIERGGYGQLPLLTHLSRYQPGQGDHLQTKSSHSIPWPISAQHRGDDGVRRAVSPGVRGRALPQTLVRASPIEKTVLASELRPHPASRGSVGTGLAQASPVSQSAVMRSIGSAPMIARRSTNETINRRLQPSPDRPQPNVLGPSAHASVRTHQGPQTRSNCAIETGRISRCMTKAQAPFSVVKMAPRQSSPVARAKVAGPQATNPAGSRPFPPPLQRRIVENMDSAGAPVEVARQTSVRQISNAPTPPGLVHRQVMGPTKPVATNKDNSVACKTVASSGAALHGGSETTPPHATLPARSVVQSQSSHEYPLQRARPGAVACAAALSTRGGSKMPEPRRLPASLQPLQRRPTTDTSLNNWLGAAQAPSMSDGSHVQRSARSDRSRIEPQVADASVARDWATRSSRSGSPDVVAAMPVVQSRSAQQFVQRETAVAGNRSGMPSGEGANIAASPTLGNAGAMRDSHALATAEPSGQLSPAELGHVADQVYELIEQRLTIERESMGL